MQGRGSETQTQPVIGPLDRILGLEDEEGQSPHDVLRVKTIGGDLLNLVKPPTSKQQFLGQQTVKDLRPL